MLRKVSIGIEEAIEEDLCRESRREEQEYHLIPMTE